MQAPSCHNSPWRSASAFLLGLTALVAPAAAQAAKKTPALPGFEALTPPAALVGGHGDAAFGVGTGPRAPLLHPMTSPGEAAPQLGVHHWRTGSWQSTALAPLPVPSEGHRRDAARTGVLPWDGDPREWTFYYWWPGGVPHVLTPSRTLTPLLLAPPCRLPPLALDLDRDFDNNVLLLPGPEEDLAGVRLPLVVSAPGTEARNLDVVEERWVTLLRDAQEIVPWDLDSDQNEDLLVPLGERRLTILENDGDDDIREVTEEELPEGEAGARLRAHALRLGPERGTLQWFVALGEGGREPRLGVRTVGEGRFGLHLPSAAVLNGRLALDARILDLDLDGHEELVLLAARPSKDGTALRAELQRFELPRDAQLPARPQGEAVPLPGARALAVGDLDGDGAQDLVVSFAGKRLPLLLRNLAAEERRQANTTSWLAVQLRGSDEMYHSLGSYVEFYLGEDRLQRMRWPPIDGRDQLQLVMTWDPNEHPDDSDPSVLVTWPDGNAIRYEATRGGFVRATR